MARYKVLKGVAHSVGHSFTSTMNYARDDYVLGHLLARGLATGEDTLTIDLLTGVGTPASLLGPPLHDLAASESRNFGRLVERHGSDLAFVRAARLTVLFDLARARLSVVVNTMYAPYVCEVVVTDDRGKDWPARFTGSWHLEARRPRIEPGLRQRWASLWRAWP